MPQTTLIPLYVVLGIVVIALIYVVSIYNLLVKLTQHCRESWSVIDTELQRRYNLIPNLVETVKGYAKHERQTLQAVIEARNRALASTGSPQSQAKDENLLVGAMRHLFALSEGYPELKASENFMQLQEELANTENRIQAARRFYNGNVRDINTRLEAFPSNLIGRAFGFAKQEFFEIEAAEIRQPVQVQMK